MLGVHVLIFLLVPPGFITEFVLSFVLKVLVLGAVNLSTTFWERF